MVIRATKSTVDTTEKPAASSAVKPLSKSRKSGKRREAIIRAAIEIINSKSYALATMSEIAASLDLRDAALYYYYPNKRALVYACHVWSLERFEATLTASEADGTTGADSLRRFIYGFFNESTRNGPQLYFGDHSYLEDPQREIIDGWAARLTLRLKAILETGITDGSLAPCEPELVVQLLLGMFIWLAKWVPSVGDLTVDRLMAAVEACSLRGLQASIQRPD